jgi:hypothetical protein
MPPRIGTPSSIAPGVTAFGTSAATGNVCPVRAREARWSTPPWIVIFLVYFGGGRVGGSD